MAEFVNEETLKKWQNRVGKAPAEVQRTVERIGVAMLGTSRRHMQEEIYSIPEDTTKSGKKKWVRTGSLYNAEQLQFAPDRAGVILTNTMVYARARHELGRDGRKTKRPAHWRDPLFKELRSTIEREYRRMTASILEGR